MEAGLRIFCLGACLAWAPGARAYTGLPPVRNGRTPRASAITASFLSPDAIKPPATPGPMEGPMPSGIQLPDGRSGIILFDGVCLFCNRWVSFVLDNDPDGFFAFASLQSATGRELLEQCGRSADDLSTLVVIDREGFYSQSTAALRVAATLRVPALNTLSSTLVNVPRPLRDGVYRVVANNRYKFLGRDEDDSTPACILRADGREAGRFLQ